MKIISFFLFSAALSAALFAEAKGEAAEASFQVSVSEGARFTMAEDSYPAEAEALMNSLYYTCSLMPGDVLEMTSRMPHYLSKKVSIALQKTGGAPGDQDVCHVGSSYFLYGETQIVKAEDGVPEKALISLSNPFLEDVIEKAWMRKQHEEEEAQIRESLVNDSTAFKITEFYKGAVITYPPSAETAEVKAFMNGAHFDCSVAPGDVFEVTGMVNHWSGRSPLFARKIDGAPGDQNICPQGASLGFGFAKARNCMLIKNLEGEPKGLSCRGSLNDLFKDEVKESIEKLRALGL